MVTDGSGKLVFNNVQAFPSFSIYPIGGNTTSYSPLAIANADGLNFGARVEIGINPPIRFPIAAVNRTWVVGAISYTHQPCECEFCIAIRLEMLCSIITQLWSRGFIRVFGM